jgi:hypothetical protein
MVKKQACSKTERHLKLCMVVKPSMVEKPSMDKKVSMVEKNKHGQKTSMVLN